MPPAASIASLPARRRRAARPSVLVRFARANIVRFLAVGSAGLAADTAVFFALAHEGLAEPLARAASLGMATMLTWRLNRRFTFGDSARQEAFEGGCYTGVALCAQGLNYAAFLILRAAFPELPALAALLCGAAFAAGFSYTGQRFFTFRGRIRR